MTKEFDSTLDIYRENLTEYKLTGNSAFKTAADNAKVWLDKYVTFLQDQAQRQANSIQSFVSDYEKTNPELVDMQKRIQQVQKEGPRLQDTYETEIEAQAEEDDVDMTPYYVKGGLIVGVLAMLAFF